jgi:nucleoid-associated protein YgaU
MPNDAKFGLVVGVGLVVTVAVVFFRKDSLAALPPKEEKAIIAVPTAQPTRPPAARQQYRPVPAKKATRTAETREGRRHVVEDGDTLFSLAVRYYGAADKFVEIYRVNRDVLTTPEHLEPGTVLTIPDLAQTAEQAPAR